MSGFDSTVELVKQAMNEELYANPAHDSVHGYFEQFVGEPAIKLVTLSGTGATSVNLFQLIGTVEIVQIHGCIVDATSMATLTGAHWDLWDSTAALPITKNDGVLSAMAVGTFFYKNANLTITMAVSNNSVGRVNEPTTGVKAFTPFVITQKTGANTYIRFTYTTAVNPINAQLCFHINYIPHTYDGVNKGTLTAV